MRLFTFIIYGTFFLKSNKINKMRLGGNDKCIAFLKEYGIPKNMPIAQKYNMPAALLYRDRIDAAANGRELPTELPVPANTSGRSTSTAGIGSGSGGNGSNKGAPVQQGTDPLPGETEAEYVTRQRILQEEVSDDANRSFKFKNSTQFSEQLSLYM